MSVHMIATYIPWLLLATGALGVALADLDLKPDTPVKKLELAGGKTYSGNAADKFVDAKLFTFAPLGGKYEAQK